MSRAGEWFIVPYGDREGWLHLQGWMLGAIKGEPLLPHVDGWLSYGTCPVCHAMVVADDKKPPGGDLTWSHEQWHARTDHPVPQELLAEARARRAAVLAQLWRYPQHFPNAKLPSAARLADTYATASATVRHTLKQLERDGLAQRSRDGDKEPWRWELTEPGRCAVREQPWMLAGWQL